MDVAQALGFMLQFGTLLLLFLTFIFDHIDRKK
ncbi:putative holin-like toxin [Streptococcus sp. 121]